MGNDQHHSIGEVLALLQDDFPDITISKIRFLETQGLIRPERTSSGYRKFYEHDLDRLRWILTQQKENFLPLKVIKHRLDSGEHDLAAADPAEADREGAAENSTESAGVEQGSLDLTDSATDVGEPAAVSTTAATLEAPSIADGAVTTLPPSVPPTASAVDTASSAEAAVTAADADDDEAAPSGEGPGVADPSRFLDAGSGVSLAAAELAAAAGLSMDQVEQLDEYGLIQARAGGRDKIYGEDALVVCRLAASFAQHGVEARHLRMYKVAAEREAGVFEQVLMPLARQQAAGRSVAATRLAELAALGDGMREAMLRRSLAQHLL